MNKLLQEKQNSWKIFDQIFKNYDLINRILSFGNDMRWRKKLNNHLPFGDDLSVLDVATGSGDQIIAFLKSAKIKKAVGIDLSKEMLSLAEKKLKTNELTTFQVASAENLPFSSESFDVASCSFGIRNVFDIEKSISEMYRILKKNGRLLILEFSIPKNRIVKFFHLTYLRYLLPFVGGLLSRNFKAYSYLNKTIESFPHGSEFCAIIQKSPFRSVTAYPLNFGAVTLYVGIK